MRFVPSADQTLELQSITEHVNQITTELIKKANLYKNHLIVIGTSTSEVIGEDIGTSGGEEVGAAIFKGLRDALKSTEIHVCFQCCEHLNRALVIERSAAEFFGYEPVSVIPVPSAGGSMASWAFKQMEDPCVVERVRAHAGIDIGETFIGMHLREVVVPLRPSIRWIGQARVNMAFTRPRLIGGNRAVYSLN